MHNEKAIQQKIESTLHSIDGIQRAEIRPFFSTRLIAQLDKSAKANWLQQWLAITTKPVFAVLALSFFVVMNIVAINTANHKKQAVQASSNATIQGFSEEYNLSVSTIYQ